MAVEVRKYLVVGKELYVQSVIHKAPQVKQSDRKSFWGFKTAPNVDSQNEPKGRQQAHGRGP